MVISVRCKGCGRENPVGSSYCNFCGRNIAEPDKMERVCAKCGTSNPPYLTFCSNCAASLPPPQMKGTPPPAPPPPPPPSKKCQFCGAAMGEYDFVCPACRRDPVSGQIDQLTPRRSDKPVIAGLLLIGAAVIGFMQCAMIFTAETPPVPSEISDYDIEVALGVCGAMVAAFSVLALAGGLLSLRRQSFIMAILGAVFGIMTLGPYLLASVLAFAALIVAVLGREDYES